MSSEQQNEYICRKGEDVTQNYQWISRQLTMFNHFNDACFKQRIISGFYNNGVQRFHSTKQVWY
jgi:hypothetical protein